MTVCPPLALALPSPIPPPPHPLPSTQNLAAGRPNPATGKRNRRRGSDNDVDLAGEEAARVGEPGRRRCAKGSRRGSGARRRAEKEATRWGTGVWNHTVRASSLTPLFSHVPPPSSARHRPGPPSHRRALPASVHLGPHWTRVDRLDGPST